MPLCIKLTSAALFSMPSAPEASQEYSLAACMAMFPMPGPQPQEWALPREGAKGGPDAVGGHELSQTEHLEAMLATISQWPSLPPRFASLVADSAFHTPRQVGPVYVFATQLLRRVHRLRASIHNVPAMCDAAAGELVAVLGVLQCST